MRFTGVALLSFLLFAFGAVGKPTPFPEPTSAASLFKDRHIGALQPPTPTPQNTRPVEEDEGEPIPAGWRIAGIAVGVLLLATLLYGAFRAWRASNLFDRQYRFPIRGEAAIRFGANRCGGHMATLNSDRARVSKTENT